MLPAPRAPASAGSARWHGRCLYTSSVLRNSSAGDPVIDPEQYPTSVSPWYRTRHPLESTHKQRVLQTLLEEHENIRAAVRALATARRREREQLRDSLIDALERHFRLEETLLHPALARRVQADFLCERVSRPSDEIRTVLETLRTVTVSDARFTELVDRLGRLIHRYFLHEEALLPISPEEPGSGRGKESSTASA